MVKMAQEKMFTVDYFQSDFFVIDLSFTVLDWSIMNRIITDKTYSFKNIDDNQRLRMCFNIFPKIRSVFHYLAENQQHCDIVILQRIFD